MRARDLTDEARDAAMSSWDRTPGARRGLGTLYRTRSLDVIFTIAPPWLPYVVMGPIAILAWVQASLPWPRLVMVALAGALTWTWVEYAMHRWLFHAPAEREAARVVLLLVHGHHHVWPDDRWRIAATPIQFGSLALLLFGIFSLALPRADALGAFGGAIIAYLAYELVHFDAHHGRAQHGWRGALQRHHMRHHHESPRARWGIGSPLWDVLLGTNR